MGQILEASIYKVEKIVSNNKKLLFFVVPKVASRSMLNTMVWDSSFGFGGKVFKEDLLTVEAKVPKLCLFTKFAFIRHPLDRIISCYKDKIFKPSEDDERWIIEPRKKMGLFKGMALESFCEFLLSEHGSDEFADRHWVTQDKLLSLYGGEWFPEHVFDVDNQEKWKEFVFQFSDIKKPIVNFNRSGSDELFVPKHLKAKLEERYREDFELLERVKT